MQMIEIDTATAEGYALDYLVAVAEGGTDFIFDGVTWGFTMSSKPRVLSNNGWALNMAYRPSLEPYHGHPILERMGGHFWNSSGVWNVKGLYNIEEDREGPTTSGPTLLTAGMRCYIVRKFGRKAMVPAALVK